MSEAGIGRRRNRREEAQEAMGIRYRMNTSDRGRDESAVMVNGLTNSRAGVVTSVGIVVGVALLFSIFVAAHFRNMPSGDDFIAILKPALAAHEQGWSALSIHEVFAQHFSHRIAPVRFMAMAQVLLFGKLDFVAFMWVGLVSWSAIFILLAWRAGFIRSSAAMVFLALVWFQPQASANCLVAMQAASNLPVILLALAAFAFRAGSGRGRWVFAWLAGLLALMTTGNGLLVLLILSLWDGLEKRWKRFGAGVVITACSVVVYFMGFTNPESQAYASSVPDIMGNLLVMTGSVANLGRMPLWAVAAGGGVLGAVAAVVLYASLRRGDMFLSAVLMFVGGSIAMASLARAGWGNAYMLQDRYLVYPLMLLSICGAYLAACSRAAVVKTGTVALGILFAVVAWWHHAPIVLSGARSATAEAVSWHLGYPSYRFAGDKSGNLAAVEEAVGLLRRSADGRIFTPQDTGLVTEKQVAHEEVFAVTGEWNSAASGYLVQVPAEAVCSDYILFEADGWQQVGFKPVPRVALGRLLRGQSQDQRPYIVATPLSHTPDKLPGTARKFVVSPLQ